MRWRSLIAILCVGASAPAVGQCYRDGLPCVTTTWIKQTDVTLDASGNATWSFDPADPPPVVPAIVHLPRAADATNPIICNWMSRSTTSVTVHCWRTNLSGLLGALFSGSIAGSQVTLVARAIP
ncbi:hypothetical protein [Sphingomonas sanguinis]|uniref:Uncharacterized protein n=1 Tax=Sphingomonas sanguinis TaxID=33051 RepID=A0A147HTQ8_9SPHN|nr:hypothetical protein [Sphingomonas sanguinis]KTT68262.1 hypothetical protein NS319_14860 [Sphingomonas sanguinis]